VHTYFIQPYAIPTPSLERTLRVGDFLLVSKFHYGARIPTTAIAAPMMHDTVPILKVKSYLKKPQLPYMRLPGFASVEKNDLVVFNWPADTVRQFFVKEAGVVKPIDKKSNYVKRCVGTPGDTLEIIDGFVYINGELLELDHRARPMYNHKVYAASGVSSRLLSQADASDFVRIFTATSLSQEQYNALIPFLMGVNQREDQTIELYTDAEGIPIHVLQEERIALKEVLKSEQLVNLPLDKVEWLQSQERIDSVVMDVSPKGVPGYAIFPNHPNYTWNEDNFGPIYLPQSGDIVSLDIETLPLYKRIIEVYENHNLKVENNSIFIDGKAADSYQFEKNYYWMMGDNRDHSEDSRSWGYVPEDHILGKPVFLWMSWDNFNKGITKMNPRWERFFTTVQGPGEPQSYLNIFLIGLAGYFGYRFWRKRKKG
jgi:signal peptidase I